MVEELTLVPVGIGEGIVNVHGQVPLDDDVHLGLLQGFPHDGVIRPLPRLDDAAHRRPCPRIGPLHQQDLQRRAPPLLMPGPYNSWLRGLARVIRHCAVWPIRCDASRSLRKTAASIR